MYSTGSVDRARSRASTTEPSELLIDVADGRAIMLCHIIEALSKVLEASISTGASLLVLECIPATLAADISSKLDIPVIGIGAGPGTDAQVLVMHDLLGLSTARARFVQNFMEGQTTIQGGLKAFVDAVKSGNYPREEHCYR